MTVSQAPGGPAVAIRPGGLFSRFLSCMVDSVIPVLAITGCWLALARLQPGSRLSLVAIMLTALVVLGWGVYVWWCGAERAATPGMRLLELEVVDLKTGGHVGWGRFFARCFVFGLLSATGIGLILMLIFLVLDSHQRGWHDRAAGAIVINRPEVARDEHGDPTGGAEVRGPRTNTVALPAHLTGATSFKPTGTAGLGIQQPGTPQQPPPHQPAPTQPPPPAHQPPQQPRQPIQQVPGSRPPQFGETPWGDHRPAGQSGWQPPQMLPEQPPTATADPDADADKTVLRPKGSGPAPAPTASWSVTLADGRAYQLRPAVLIGRNPDPREGQQAELVTMNDETRTVSKNHLLVGVDEQGPFVVDLGSRNGSGIRAAHGGFNRIPVGEKVRLGPGAVVSFGEQRLELHAG